MANELLTDARVRNTKPTKKDQRLNDGRGLYLIISGIWTYTTHETKSGHIICILLLGLMD